MRSSIFQTYGLHGVNCGRLCGSHGIGRRLLNASLTQDPSKWKLDGIFWMPVPRCCSGLDLQQHNPPQLVRWLAFQLLINFDQSSRDLSPLWSSKLPASYTSLHITNCAVLRINCRLLSYISLYLELLCTAPNLTPTSTFVTSPTRTEITFVKREFHCSSARFRKYQTMFLLRALASFRHKWP